MRATATSLLAIGLLATLAQADEALNGTWVAVSGGVIPGNLRPLPVGRYPNGRSVYLCRAHTGQDPVAVGRVVEGSNVCVAVNGKRIVGLHDYDLLVATVARRPPALAAATAAAAAPVAAIAVAPVSPGARRIQLARERLTHGVVQLPGNLGTNCASALNSHAGGSAQSMTARYGNVGGRSGAFVEEHYGDGYTLYHFAGGTVVAPPGGAQVFCPLMVAYADVQYGSPPPLPSDRMSGAAWVEHHNSQLLAIIQNQVANDQGTVSAIQADEAAKTGGDPFKQTDYLTGIADFYAAHGP
jgi:hypothetical protein